MKNYLGALMVFSLVGLAWFAFVPHLVLLLMGISVGGWLYILLKELLK